MTGIFGALEVARQGLIVTQAGLRNTGHNIANVNTPGYSQQRVLQASQQPIRTAFGLLGAGVSFLGIERLSDPFVQAQLIRQLSATGSAEAQSNALGVVENILNEQDIDGITATLSELYDALQDLATTATPGQPAERAALVASAQSVLDTLHVSDSRLRDLMASLNDGIAASLPRINLILDQINELNGEITRTELGPTANANDLRDQRDELLRELAGYMDLQFYERDDGAIAVTLTNGIALVEGNRARSLVAVPDPTNLFSIGFFRIAVRDLSFQVDVTNEIASGKIGGLLRARDTILAGAVRSLDTVAYNLVASVNAVHNLGQGLTGATGDFFAALPMVEDAARDIQIAANILANPDDIAVGLTSATGDNQNALALAALRDSKSPLFLPGDPPGPASGPSRSVIDHAVAVAIDIGQQTRNLISSVRQQQKILEGLENRRDQISGVSIDEEVTNLIKLQAAFQANARIIAVVQTLLDDLVNML